MDNKGKKFDQGKPDWSLIPFPELEEIVKVMTFGASKYGRNDWQHVEPSRYKAAMLRHMTEIDRGEKIDSESGLPHAAHLACNALFLLWFDINGFKSGN